MTTAKIFKSGNGQAVQLPKEFQFKETEVYFRKRSNCVILIPEDDPWRIMRESISEFSDDVFSEGRNLSPPQEREGPDDLLA